MNTELNKLKGQWLIVMINKKAKFYSMIQN